MFKRLVKEYIVQVVVAVGVTTTVAIWAVIQKHWNWPTAFVDSVLLICGLWWLIDRLGFGQPPIRNRVRDWLDRAGFGVKTVSDKNSIHFVVLSPPLTLEIMQETNDAHITISAFGLTFNNHKEKEAYETLNDYERYTFWKRVRLELLRYGISHTDLKLEGVAVYDQIQPSQSLTIVEFVQRVRFVWCGARLYQELFMELAEGASFKQSTSEAIPPQT